VGIVDAVVGTPVPDGVTGILDIDIDIDRHDLEGIDRPWCRCQGI